MNTYSFDPVSVNLRRVQALVSSIGGTASIVQRKRTDGSDGVAMLLVTVPESVAAGTVEAVVAQAAGVAEQQQDAWEASTNIQKTKDAFDATDIFGRSFVAVVRLLLDETNDLRQWITSLKSAVSRADSLADLRSRVAAMTPLESRTLAQAKTAYKNAVGAG